MLKNLTPVFHPVRSKTKKHAIAACKHAFSRALSKPQVIARNSDWFTALYAPVVIGYSDNYFGIVVSTVNN